MHQFFLLMVALLSISCATTTRQTDELVKNPASMPLTSKIIEVPYIKQKDFHCGPATLGMVLRNASKKIDLTTLTSQMFTEKLDGTFQSDMVSTARHHGMVTIPVNDLKSLLLEIESGHPVIVFQNLGFSWFPKWHYSVALGHDLRGPDIYLHSGAEKFMKVDMRFFERSWKLANHWGLMVLRPDELSATASELTHADAAAMLEEVNQIDNARIAYETMLGRWPQSLPAFLGLGNVDYKKKDFQKAVRHLKLAVKYHPESAVAWHNLATAQGASGDKRQAKISSDKALTLADDSLRDHFKVSLRQWLN